MSTGVSEVTVKIQMDPARSCILELQPLSSEKKDNIPLDTGNSSEQIVAWDQQEKDIPSRYEKHVRGSSRRASEAAIQKSQSG
jgi:hypothetical protein